MSLPSIPELRKLVDAHRPACARDGYPVHVRQAIAVATARLRDAGWTDARLARELGLSSTSLRVWLRSAPTPGFRQVAVVVEAEATRLEAPSPTARLTLVTPRGYRLEGLDVEMAVALLGRLG